MGAFDKITDKAKDLMESSGDKIAEGVDKATDMIDDKTGGKYSGHLDKVDDMASKLDKSQRTDADADADTAEDEDDADDASSQDT